MQKTMPSPGMDRAHARSAQSESDPAIGAVICTREPNAVLLDSGSDACWSDLAEYAGKLPRELRGVRGVFLDVIESALPNHKCAAATAIMRLALLDGSDPEK